MPPQHLSPPHPTFHYTSNQSFLCPSRITVPVCWCREGFVQALLLIFFSEIGDKTFFIALLLALQQPRSLVFAGTFGALAVMTVISVGLGRFLHVLDEVRGLGGLGGWVGGWEVSVGVWASGVVGQQCAPCHCPL